MIIQIVSAYDEIAWYSKLIGETFEVLEKDKSGDVKVKRGDGRYSYWVGKNDYNVIS